MICLIKVIKFYGMISGSNIRKVAKYINCSIYFKVNVTGLAHVLALQSMYRKTS